MRLTISGAIGSSDAILSSAIHGSCKASAAVGRCLGSYVSSLRTVSLAASDTDGHGACEKSTLPFRMDAKMPCSVSG